MTESVELHGVGKRYWQVHERGSAVGALLKPRRAGRTELWALRDVDLSIGAGDAVGLIGRNGAGKSSLLRLLAGVSQPTTGAVDVHGRIAPLLSVGVGFHAEMTGRENVYVNAMLLGLRKAEIDRRFDEIVAFAELEAFIDTPVKFYSTGMFMRLGFAVAINVEPDVLLVDEVIAVGDVGFQHRCLERMRELHDGGTTIVFVSHHMHAVHLLCPRTVVLHQGEVAFDGPTDPAIARYHELVSTRGEPSDGPILVLERALLAGDQPVAEVNQGDELTYRMRLRFQQEVDGPSLCFRIGAEDASVAYSMQTPTADRWRTYQVGEEADVEVRFRANLGGGGSYFITVDIGDAHSRGLLRDAGPTFFVPPLLGVTGPADLGATIVVDGELRTDHRWTRFGGEELHLR